MNFYSPVVNGLSNKIHINNSIIGKNNPCYIIAEAGSSNDRDLITAIELINVSEDAGCDVIKFQSFTGDVLASDKVKIVRPGVGLGSMMFLELLLRKRVNRDIPADHPLIWDDFIDY